ncbi:MAG: LPS biosynthesis protein [Legionellales bacterium RIFCSPHIGHO2_12_FULL_35_11]|nr:MAG: LPS biosynthesis protein [Legionellales bacterium RIFCSPHIGHO2_12_FULL_35_11]
MQIKYKRDIISDLIKGYLRVVTKIKYYHPLIGLGFVCIIIIVGAISASFARSQILEVETIQACVIPSSTRLDNSLRAKISDCLGFEKSEKPSCCSGYYKPVHIKTIADPDEIEVTANNSSLYLSGKSQLKGNVKIRRTNMVVSTKTASIYRDPQTKKITKIELEGGVNYVAPDVFMYASNATLYPEKKSGKLNDVIYRYKTNRALAFLPAWGRARLLQRFANEDYLLNKATYTTCAPKDKSWQIKADEIKINTVKSTGIAKNAYLEIRDIPIFYTPYLSFPTTQERKSGFLMPIYGYTNVSGFDVGFPYYFNIAPNFDLTFMPHVYSFRGVMLGGNARFLTEKSTGTFGLTMLPKDAAFNSFLIKNRDNFPVLQDVSSNRWSVMLNETSHFTDNLTFNINFRQLSDDYYFQDFSTNLAVASANQILREGDLTYNTKHWTFFGMMQSYQTLHAINQAEVSNIYERFPQLSAKGSYYDLPMKGVFQILGQFDNFHWTGLDEISPQGPRYHVNPTLSFPQVRPWGYINPEIQLVENYYDLNSRTSKAEGSVYMTSNYNRTIPRYSIDSGLTFYRHVNSFGDHLKQTFEPRVYYLNIPYRNQSFYPAFDSAYMIFNTDQLFRDNRFSGYDRIGDANQLAYAGTLRWISPETGLEIANFRLGQIRYFSERKVQLCYNQDGSCVDSPLFLGYVSPLATYSPIASKLTYALTSVWSASADYVWDPYTKATNNGNFNILYQPTPTRILSFGFNYMVSGNILDTPGDPFIENTPLNQATFSYAWPFTENWSSLGAYSYNISENYAMMGLFGLQYDSCCWAARLIGGRQFKSLNVDSQRPEYNNSIYVQILLKGLGSVTNTDPASTIKTYLPSYPNIFSQ